MSTVSDEKIISMSDTNTTTIHNFIQHIVDSSTSLSLKSLTLYGMKAARKKRRLTSSLVDQDDPLRGCIRQVQGRLIKLTYRKKKGLVNEGEEYYLQVTFKFHSATDIVKNWKIPQEAQEEMENLLLGHANSTTSIIQSEWGKIHQNMIQSMKLVTLHGTWTLDLTSQNQQNLPCTYIPPTDDGNNTVKDIEKSFDHDQRKNVLMSSSEVFLQKLGVVGVDGKPKIGMASKLRQCQRFIEIMGTMIDSSSFLTTQINNTFTTVDMGCGRGYLTFALHTYLMNQPSFKSIQVITRGVDIRPKIIAEVNDIALTLGQTYNGLQFIQGTIESLHSSYNNELSPLHILVALHACDTATDDAIWFGIQRSAAFIVTAPCCHKEIRMHLDPYISTQLDHPQKDILRHGIYRERMSEMITDSLRALLLEYSHYDVQVFEFIGGEHTSKNVMITARRRKIERTEHELELLRERIMSLVSLYGIRRQHLAYRMGLKFTTDHAARVIHDAKNMPPLL